jgi:hypothetical protein
MLTFLLFTVTIEMLLVLSQLEFDETLTSPKSIEDLHYMAMFKYGASPLFRYDVTPYADGDNTLETLTVMHIANFSVSE